MPERGPPPAKILFINVCRIGDTLLATPALRALAAAYPGAEITALGHPKRIEVLHHLPWLASAGGISKAGALARGWLAGKAYDLALVYGFDAPLVAYALRAARRVVAFRQADERLNRRLYRAVEPPAFQAAHSVHLALRLTDAIGVPHAGYRLAYRVTEAEARWAESELAPIAGEPRIGLQVASFPTKAYRDWPLESFAELARRIRARWPEARFLLFGGAEDRGRTRRLAAQLGGCADFAGRVSLRQSAALMSRTHLYVGVDTGPTHLMGCFDIPLVALYHCYSPSRLLRPLEHPCFHPVDHPRPYPCATETPMGEIAVEAVFGAVERALGASAP
ncbi:MAG: glycosyltransferase family 9 protein [Pseudomonadota bacterium]